MSETRYMGTTEVRKVLPVSVATATRIITSLPHIKLPGEKGKLLIERKEFEAYLRRATVVGKREAPPPPTPEKKRQWVAEGLTEEGLIPYRHSRKGGSDV